MYQQPGQPVYYQGANMSQGFVYPQQMMQSMPRGWQPQYSVPYNAGNVGVMPSRGGAASASSAPRGRGGASGNPRGGSTGGGRGGANRRAQQAPAQETQREGELSIAQVKQYPVEQQKLYIGERLYSLISLAHPTLAGKITGMFLESGWPIDELFSLLTDETKLTEKIDDAIGVLERAQQGTDGEEAPIEGEDTH